MMNNETASNDTLSYVDAETNSTYEVGQLIMIRKEFISGAVMVGKHTTKLKVKTYWTPARIMDRWNINNYIVKLGNGELRKVHRMICRNRQDGTQQEPEDQYENR